jgi:tetratricopeptide (TPR) repeat protein
MRRVFASCALLAPLWCSSLAPAHEGVNVQIQNIGQKIQQDPTNPAHYIERATLYRREKQFSKALSDLALAEKLAPNRRDIQLDQGLTLAAKGDHKEAERILSGQIASGLPSVKAFLIRGNVREHERRFAEARADYHAALTLEKTLEAFLGRGRMDEALGHWDDAAKGYEEGLRALAGAVVLRLALIRAEHHLGHYDRAITFIDEILPQLPLKGDWLLLRADEHAAAGRAEKTRQDRLDALREADDRLARRPTDLAALSRIKALRALGRLREALHDVEIVVQHAPKFDEARFLRDDIRRLLSLEK